MNPLLSIVIANYNYGRFLSEAIESVLSQSCQDFEIIIIDGGSTDDSVEVIRKYADEKTEVKGLGLQRDSKISYWVSEPDKGQSDAFNKGFAKARGRFLTWLNADDVMLPGTIEKLKRATERHPKCEWFVGGVMWLNKDMTVRLCARARAFSTLRAKRGVISVWGPSSFFTKGLLDRVGGVDIRYSYCMDNNLWLRFYFKEGVKYLPFADYAWGLRMHEEAKMSAHNFASSGQQNNPDHPKWRQLRREGEWNREIHGSSRKPNRFELALSLSPVKALLSRFDTRRFSGLHYKKAVGEADR